MLTSRIELMQSTEPAHWLRDRLASWWRRRGHGKTVGWLAPEGYDAYARLYHMAAIQAPDKSWEPVRWSQLAQENNKAVHPAMTFREVANLAIGEHIKGLAEPDRWLNKRECHALLDVLKQFTTTPERCYFAVWRGYGLFDGQHGRRLFGWQAEEWVGKALVQLSRREADYILLRGPLDAMPDFHGWLGDRWFGQTPDIWWPEDRAWCVSSDIDTLDTCVAGSQDCISAVLDAPELETFRTTLDDTVDL